MMVCELTRDNVMKAVGYTQSLAVTEKNALVDVEIDNGGYKLEIKENNENLMVIERDDPFISIRIEKKTSKEYIYRNLGKLSISS